MTDGNSLQASDEEELAQAKQALSEANARERMGQKTVADLQQRLSKASASAQAQVQQLQHQMGQVSAVHHTPQASGQPCLACCIPGQRWHSSLEIQQCGVRAVWSAEVRTWKQPTTIPATMQILVIGIDTVNCMRQLGVHMLVQCQSDAPVRPTPAHASCSCRWHRATDSCSSRCRACQLSATSWLPSTSRGRDTCWSCRGSWTCCVTGAASQRPG